jgi:hypothetical protein
LRVGRRTSAQRNPVDTPDAFNGAPNAAGSAKAALLGTVKHGKVTQVTYNHHPLYTFTSDSKSAPMRRGSHVVLRREPKRQQDHQVHEDDHQQHELVEHVQLPTRVVSAAASAAV